jgi:hypothetical protein
MKNEKKKKQLTKLVRALTEDNSLDLVSIKTFLLVTEAKDY